MQALKEQNRKLEERFSNFHYDVFRDVDHLRSMVQEQENLLKEKEWHVISQGQPYKSIEMDIINLI